MQSATHGDEKTGATVRDDDHVAAFLRDLSWAIGGALAVVMIALLVTLVCNALASDSVNARALRDAEIATAFE